MAFEDYIRLAPAPRELNDGQRYTVFLSYRSVNRSWVIALHDALVEAGHTVFLDQTALVAGENLRKAIGEALMASQAGILIWSNAAQDSKWVNDEYDVLKNRSMNDEENFFFVPIRLDDTPLPPLIDNQIFIDFGSYPDGPNGGELLRLLHGIVGLPLSQEAMRYSEELSETTRKATFAIDAALTGGDMDRLLELSTSQEDCWKISPQLGCNVAEALIKLGNNEKAVELTEYLIAQFPRALRPKQLHGHAHTRINTVESLTIAKRVLGELVAADHRDPETMGLYGKVWFEDYIASGDSVETRDRTKLRFARNQYQTGFLSSRDDTYCGINAATKTLLLGGETAISDAKEIALEVMKRLPETIEADMGYWDGATIAEATLIGGDFDKAAELYQQAVDLSPMEKPSHQSTYNSVQVLCDQLQLGQEIRDKLSKPFVD